MTTGSRPRFSVRVGRAAAPNDDPFEDVSADGWPPSGQGRI
ncbi:hypothetical protein ACH4GE_41085 [Streptomyces tendae]